MSRSRTANFVLGATIVLAVVSIFAAPGCSSGEVGGSDPNCDATLESIRSSIFVQSCGSPLCHGGDDPAGQLNLVDGDIDVRLAGVNAGTCDGWQLVVPGKPEESLLWLKLYSDSPPCGDPMPLGTFLPATQLACVRDWILNHPPVQGCETCGGADCIDLQSDPINCGGCGVACPAGSACTNGSCQCAGTLDFCGGGCVDTQSSTSHCGACDNGCGTGALCNVGQCVCGAGLEACAGACSDTNADPANCGGCGTKCASTEVCFQGSCASGCGALTQCGQSCVDTNASAFHCGACDAACAAGASCVGGKCACPAGTADCGGTCIDTFSDPSNCGACGNACPAGQVCSAGACECPGGGTYCSGKCVDTASDLLNCGGCGKACGGGQSCNQGVCTCGSTTATFANDVQPIFSASCASKGCHSGVKPAASLPLTEGASYAALVGAQTNQCGGGRVRVVPGDPARSYLMQKLLGVDLCTGTQMPKAGQSIPSAQIDAIGAWICAGAANN